MDVSSNYRVWVGAIQDVPDGVEYYRVNPQKKYMLLYTDTFPFGDFESATDEEAERDMTAQDKAWLFHCKAEIGKKYLQEYADFYLDFFDKLINEFERELKKGAGENGE